MPDGPAAPDEGRAEGGIDSTPGDTDSSPKDTDASPEDAASSIEGAYWELDADGSPTLHAVTHAVYGLLAALLFVLPFLLAIPVFWVIERLGILSLLLLVMGLIGLQYVIWVVVWPALAHGQGPFSLPWGDAVSVSLLVQAGLGWLFALVVTVRYWPAPAVLAGVGLLVGLPAVRLGWTRGEVDPVSGDLSVDGRPLSLGALASFHRLDLRTVSLFWLRYDGRGRGRRFFLVPADVAGTVVAALERET